MDVFFFRNFRNQGQKLKIIYSETECYWLRICFQFRNQIRNRGLQIRNQLPDPPLPTLLAIGKTVITKGYYLPDLNKHLLINCNVPIPDRPNAGRPGRRALVATGWQSGKARYINR